MKEHESKFEEMREKISDELKEKVNPKLSHKLYNKNRFNRSRL